VDTKTGNEKNRRLRTRHARQDAYHAKGKDRNKQKKASKGEKNSEEIPHWKHGTATTEYSAKNGTRTRTRTGGPREKRDDSKDVSLRKKSGRKSRPNREDGLKNRPAKTM